MALTAAQIEAALSALVTSGAQSYSIGNRSVSKLDLLKLYELQKKIEFDENRSSYGAFRLAKMVRPR